MRFTDLVRLRAPMVEEASATSGMISNRRKSFSTTGNKDRKNTKFKRLDHANTLIALDADP